MKNLIFLFGLFLSFFSIAQSDTAKVNTSISDVTIFFNGAEVTRSKSITLRSGKQLLFIDKLPQDLYPQSIQVKGLKDAKILSVKHQINIDDIVKKQKEEKLLEELIEEQFYNIDELNNEYNVAEIEERFLLENSKLKKSGNSSDLTNLISSVEYYKTQILEIRTQKLNIQKKTVSKKKEIEALYKKLNQLTVEKRQPKSQVFITIETKKSSTENLRLSYYIPTAGWEPTYDFRVEEITKPLELVYNANIYQSSGEDWKKVNITLSSNNPSVGSTNPELQPWILGQNRFQKTEISKGNANTIRGRISDSETNDPIPFANIILKQNKQIIMGSTTDFDGLYTLKPVPSGIYTIEASYIGYNTQDRMNINCNFNKTQLVDLNLSKGSLFQEVNTYDYKKPLFEKDKTTTGTTITREELQNMAVRTPYDLAKLAGNGVFSRDDGAGSVNSRGSRSNSNVTFIDGVKIIESTNDFESTDLISNSIKNKIANLEYKIEVPYTILSDGQDYALKIKSVNIPVEYEYHSYPGIESDAFLNAKLTNWAGLNLFSGKTNIFYQGTFTNESILDVENTKDTMLISLGRDKSVYISKNLNRKLYDKNTFAGNVKENLVWDITVKNNKIIPIKIIIHDQFPISQRKSFEVELNNISKAEVDTEKAYLTWNLDLKPNESKLLQFGILVKYPKYANINIH